MKHAENADFRRTTLLGPGTDIKGELVTDEELVILGRVSGRRVRATAITIGPKAEVRANIETRTIRIEGVVVGDIHAEISVMVQSSATVRGVISCPVITIREGASINGAANVRKARSAADAETSLRKREAAGTSHR